MARMGGGFGGGPSPLLPDGSITPKPLPCKSYSCAQCYWIAHPGEYAMRILIVDDDRFTRRRLQLSLVQGGYDVLDADDGRTAWDMLQREQVRLVITDWMMPD